MALFDTTWYISSVAYAAVTARPQNTAVAAGVVRRQFTAPAVNNERVFVCFVAGTTANTTDATWNISRASKTTDGTVQWMECTGMAAVNGDLAGTPSWSAVKASTLSANQGVIIKRNNGASYQLATTGGFAPGASEPAFSDTAGVTTNDGPLVWTSLGPVGNFPAWGAPHARLANAYANTWGVAGNKFWIADNHAETQATAISLTNPATVVLATYTICVDRTAALPPVEANYNTGATLTTTGASAINLRASATANMYYQGLSFRAGDSTNLANINADSSGSTYVFKNCSFFLVGTGSSSIILGSNSSPGNAVLWDNCQVQFAAVTHRIQLPISSFEWRNTPTAILGSTFPTSLFNSAFSGSVLICRGVDLSAFSGILIGANFSAASTTPAVFEDCKLHPTVTRYASTSNWCNSPLVTVRCDSGAANYKSTRDEYSGAQTTETSITRVGGATDGTTPSSIKIATNAQAAFLTPYRMLRLAAWNDVVGADRTVTVCGTINAASLPLNDELWMDVQYLGSSGSPVASFKTTCKSHPLAAGAAVASDGSTWNGGGSGAGWSPFKLVATLTSPQPQMKGYLYASIRAAKASTTYYIDPQITLG